MELFIDIMQILAVLLVGLAIGFFAAKKYMENHIKKNPPINEQMIRAMMTQMGRTPSQKQVNQMMKAMTKYL